jgi:hypothetical protein
MANLGWIVLAVLAIAGAGWFFGNKAFKWLGKNKKD